MSTRAREGFSLVELMVALVILTAGMLAMASASGFSSMSVQIAGNRTARAAAVASEIEQIKSKATSANFTSIGPQTTPVNIDGFDITYTVSLPSPHYMVITVTSSGRGYVPRQGWRTVQETFTAQLVKPAP